MKKLFAFVAVVGIFSLSACTKHELSWIRIGEIPASDGSAHTFSFDVPNFDPFPWRIYVGPVIRDSTSDETMVTIDLYNSGPKPIIGWQKTGPSPHDAIDWVILPNNTARIFEGTLTELRGFEQSTQGVNIWVDGGDSLSGIATVVLTGPTPTQKSEVALSRPTPK